MAAGVHVAVGGGEGKPRVLRHIEGVIIRPDAEDLSGFFPLNEGHYPAPAVPVTDLVSAHFAELVHDELLRSGSVEADFRIGMERAPPLGDLAVQFLRFFLYVEHGYHLLLFITLLQNGTLPEWMISWTKSISKYPAPQFFPG